MTTEEGELLSALIDREPVDPEALERLLEDPRGRRALVEFASIRRTLQTPLPRESQWLSTAPPSPVLLRALRPPWRMAAASALLVVATAAGVFAERYRARERPPEPARVVQFDPLPGNEPTR